MGQVYILSPLYSIVVFTEHIKSEPTVQCSNRNSTRAGDTLLGSSLLLLWPLNNIARCNIHQCAACNVSGWRHLLARGGRVRYQLRDRVRFENGGSIPNHDRGIG